MPIPAAYLDALKGRLTSSIVYTPESKGYKESLNRWSDTAVKPAGVVVQPLETADVRTALLWAQEHQLDLAVKGGGHTVRGTSSSDGGLVIDLYRMNRVMVDPAAKTLSAQGGALWRDVDTVAAEHGLAVVAGTVNHGGVGGVTLGGGFGWLSAQHGLAADNLLSVTVVLADGCILKTSETEHPDLFWALRGAGHNFGIVIEFTFRAHEQQSHVVAGMVTFEHEKFEAGVKELNALLQSSDERCGTILAICHPPSLETPGFAVFCFYNGSWEVGTEEFAGLRALNPRNDTLDMIPYERPNELLNPVSTFGDRKSFKGIYFHTPLDTRFAYKMMNQFREKLEQEPDLRESSIVMEYFDLRKICQVPLSATGLAGRKNAQNGVICMRWIDPSRDARYNKWAGEMQAQWKAQMDASGTQGECPQGVLQYINYAEPGDCIVPNIFGDNLGRLQQIKAKYDPRNVFNKIHVITPASSAPDGT